MISIQRSDIDGLLDELIQRFYSTVQGARLLLDSDVIDRDYYIRHTIETILRIRLARMADARLILLFTKQDPLTARKWAEYAADEMLHDRLFLADLNRLGVAAEDVYGTAPLLSTRLLQGYLYYSIEHESPVGLLSKAYFLEYVSAATQPLWINNIANVLGSGAARGALAHVDLDRREEHSSFVWESLYAQLTAVNDEKYLIQCVHLYAALFSAYFDELYERTINKRQAFTFHFEVPGPLFGDDGLSSRV